MDIRDFLRFFKQNSTFYAGGSVPFFVLLDNVYPPPFVRVYRKISDVNPTAPSQERGLARWLLSMGISIREDPQGPLTLCLVFSNYKMTHPRLRTL